MFTLFVSGNLHVRLFSTRISNFTLFEPRLAKGGRNSKNKWCLWEKMQGISKIYFTLYGKKMNDQTRKGTILLCKTRNSLVTARNKCLSSNVYPLCLRGSACTIILNNDSQFHRYWAQSCKKEEKLAKSIEIFGKKRKESRKYISPSRGKKCLIKQEKQQFYTVKRANL